MSTLLKILLCFIGFVTFYGCSSGDGDLTEEQLEVAESLRDKFGEKSVLVYGSDTLLAGKSVLEYYASHDFAPVWTLPEKLNDQGEQMVSLIAGSRNLGLLPEMFHYRLLSKMKDSSLLDAEMLLSNAFFLMISHVDLGCIDTGSFEYVWKANALNYAIDEELERVFNGENPQSIIAEKEPKNWDYQQLKIGLTAFLQDHLLDTNHFEIPKFRDDSVLCYKVAREALFGHGFIDSTGLEDDSVFLDSLRVFQLLCGLKDDAIVGRWTGHSLSKSNTDRFLQAALSMEKWRWKPDTLPSKYFRVNIPEFTLYFVDNDTLKSKNRVIVGATITPTPEFSARMETIVTNPVWHVPYSIASTEIVAAGKKDTSYFSKRNYKVFRDGVEQNVGTIDWSKLREGNFPYRVQQGSGGGNSLGRIKFLFPNLEYVFLHDTPSKYLFGNDVRAYSHGCIRLENPIELGIELLRCEVNEIAPDTLDSIIFRGQNMAIRLAEPFPVILEYFTATGDSAGNIIFHPDIYGRDEKFLMNSFARFTK